MSRLVELYQEQIRLLQELLGLLQRDAEIVRSGSVSSLDELLENNKRKETLALKLRVIEEEKRKAKGEALEPYEGQVRALAREIARQGERNRVLLEGSLSLIRSMLGILSPPQAYGPQGNPVLGAYSRSRGKV